MKKSISSFFSMAIMPHISKSGHFHRMEEFYKMDFKQEHHVDLRIQKTREAIKNTFKEMICEMPAEKITIKELTDRARIHRKTFYLHYTSIEALYQDMMAEIADGYYTEMAKIKPPYSHKDANRIFFTYYSQQSEYVQRLICEPSYRPFCNKLHAATLQHNRSRYNPFAKLSPEKQNMINTFLVISSLELYRQWISDGKKIPLEEVINLTGKLLEEGISGISINE